MRVYPHASSRWHHGVEDMSTVKQVEFFTANLLQTRSMFESVKCGALPSFLVPFVSIDTNSWMIKNGNAEYESSTVKFPQAGYSCLICSAEQVDDLRNWLDNVSPGWESVRDGYGNPCVQISEPRRDPLSNLVSPEARGDYV